MARSFKSSFLTGRGMLVTVDLRGLRKLTVDVFFWSLEHPETCRVSRDSFEK